MTQTSVKIKNTYALLKSFFVFAAFLLFSVFASNGIAGYTFEGMMLAIKVIVPTVFPFMIFSDIASRCFEFEKSNFLLNLQYE